MSDFDPTDPKTERRRYYGSSDHELASVIGILQDQISSLNGTRKNFWLKYWPVFLVVGAFAGSTTTFYFNTLQLGEEMKQLKSTGLVNQADLQHELRYRDISINNLDSRISEYQERSKVNFDKFDKKLDQIQEYLRKLGGG